MFDVSTIAEKRTVKCHVIFYIHKSLIRCKNRRTPTYLAPAEFCTGKVVGPASRLAAATRVLKFLPYSVCDIETEQLFVEQVSNLCMLLDCIAVHNNFPGLCFISENKEQKN